MLILKSVPKKHSTSSLYFRHSFMPSSSKYLCSTYNMSGTILGFGDRAGKKTDRYLCTIGAHIPGEGGVGR